MSHKRLLIIALNLVFLTFLFLFSAFNWKENPVSPELTPDLKNYLLTGTEKGLYFWDFQNDPVLVYQGGEVKKLLETSDGFYLLTSEGVLFSKDLKKFEPRNKGLIEKVVKHYRNGQKSFSREIQDLKDLKADPSNPKNLVTCTKDGVFYSTNGGLDWSFIKNPTTTTGIKSVLIYSDPDLQILFSHPFRGVFHKNLTKKTGWKEINHGLLQYSGVQEEVSDLVLDKRADGSYRILAANNFSPVLYSFNSKTQKWETLLKMKEDFAMMESLFPKEGKVYFVSNLGLMEYAPDEKALNRVNFEKVLTSFEEKSGQRMNTAYLVKDGKLEYDFSNLWLLSQKTPKPYLETASGKRGFYVQADKVRNRTTLKNIREQMESLDYNMLVIDMKDDFGNLRFHPDHPLLTKYGEAFNPVNLKEFIPYMKEKNIYLVARIVVFKDKVLYRYGNGQFAVKDASTGQPWRGMVKSEGGGLKLNSEQWVDPYSEQVWEYNIEIAKELIAKGFDEVQFDYIRFPTDGENLHQARFPYQDAGMDKESALISFLSYARENIQAPISVDIYGANGWHRTGARTGQDVELLQKYVDVICPMYYPSHFAQNFMYFPPYEQRTWRIYYYGSFRNFYIARKNAVIRPYLQAFKMNRSYDNAYYGPQYIRNQVKGVHQSIDMGYTFWNSGSKYSILLDTFADRQKLTLNKKEQEGRFE